MGIQIKEVLQKKNGENYSRHIPLDFNRATSRSYSACIFSGLSGLDGGLNESNTRSRILVS